MMDTTRRQLEHFFRCGKFLGYIRTLRETMEQCLDNGNHSQLETLLTRVYNENSGLLDFFNNYHALIQTMDEYTRVQALKTKLLFRGDIPGDIKAGAKAVLEAIENYLSPSYQDNFENEKLKYMVLPVIAQSKPGNEPIPVFNYIYHEPVAVPDDHWSASQFYSFNDKIPAWEYLDTLLDEIKANLFFQDRMEIRGRIDIPEIRKLNYRILFGQKVTGRSYGGAMLVLMLLGFIETLCGKKGHGFGDYKPATMIQAVIQPGGQVKPTDNLPLKTNAFLDEYGTQKVYLVFAEGSQERLDLKYRQGKYIIGNHSIDSSRIKFVKNTGELFEAAFPNWHHLISTVWQKLSDSYIRNLYLNLADGWTPEKIERELLVKPSKAKDMLPYICADRELKASFNYYGENEGIFDLRFGFEENTFFPSSTGEPISEIVVIAVDGSVYTEPYWSGDGSEDSKIAQAIFEIIKTMAKKNRSFYLHFLSDKEPELLNINRFTNSIELNDYLKKRRVLLKIHLRGNFISPVVRYWSTKSLATHKRIIFITNGPVYDGEDFDLKNVFRENLWFCFNQANEKYLPQHNTTCLNDISNDIREKLKVSPRRITKAKLIFRNWLPYEWNNIEMALKNEEKDDNTRFLEYEPGKGTASIILNGAFLSNLPSKMVDYKIEVKEESETYNISGCLQGGKSDILLYNSEVITGQLLEDECEVWANFTNESENYVCPVCGCPHNRALKCSPAGEFMPQIIFPSLRSFRGYLILEENRKEWLIAKTGAKIDDIYFFKMNGLFYAFCPGSSSQPEQIKHGKISIDSRVFYITEL